MSAQSTISSVVLAAVLTACAAPPPARIHRATGDAVPETVLRPGDAAPAQTPLHFVVRTPIVPLTPVVDSGPERLYTAWSERVRVTDDTVEHAPSFTSRIVGTARCGDGWLFESEEGTVAYASSFTGELLHVIDVPPAGVSSPDPLLSSTPIAEAAPYAWRLTEGP